MQSMLADQHPAIVFLKTGALEYWNMDIFHTAVLIGLDGATVALHDPYFATGPQSIPLQSFEKAWAATGQSAALIRPRRKS
jgi:predicted double-glycine peptidase